MEHRHILEPVLNPEEIIVVVVLVVEHDKLVNVTQFVSGFPYRI